MAPAGPDIAEGADGPQGADVPLLVDVPGYEGPLDVLLDLARRQKVDLRAIDVAELADQYLAFVARGHLPPKVQAAHLVTAAWLAYLKSRLLLPPEEAEAADAEAEAAALALRLRRLEAMRAAGAKLMDRDILGVSRHARGAPEPAPAARIVWEASLADLLRAYAALRTRDDFRPYAMDRTDVLTMEEALEALRRAAPREWTDLGALIPEGWHEGARARSAAASTFAASLELVRRGEADLAQEAPLGPLRLRARA